MSNVARVEPKRQELTLAPDGSPMAGALVFLQNGGNIEQLNQMMDLQTRWETNEARKAFTVAMAGFKSEPITIYKAKNVSFSGTSYNHAELSDVTDAVGPALAKHQLAYRWNIRQDAGLIKVECILTHVSGHSESVTMQGSPDDSGRKNAIQQVASTTTYLERYTLLAITGMSTKGMDDDGRQASQQVPEVDTTAWHDAIASAIDMTGLNKLADELKTANLTGNALRNIRAAWAKRSKEVAA